MLTFVYLDGKATRILDIRCIESPVTVETFAFDRITSIVGLDSFELNICLNRVLFAGELKVGFFVENIFNMEGRFLEIHRTAMM